MKRTKILGLALVAAFAMSVVAAAAAQAAAPEFNPNTKQSFTAASTKSSVLKGEGVTITCTKNSAKGEITGATGAKSVGGVVVTFTGCTGAEEGKTPCEVDGGTITTETLSGELGPVSSGATSKVGEDLKPTTATFYVELKGSCIPTTKVKGSIIGEVTPTKTKQLTGKLVYECASGKPTTQKITKFESGSKDVLEAFGAEACLEAEDTVTFTKEVEVT